MVVATTCTSQKILAAALKCISEAGCHTVTLRSIAKEADVVLSQLNYYFKNKEGLFSAVLNYMRDVYIASIDNIMENSPTTKEKLEQLIIYNRDLLEKNTSMYRAFLDFFNLAIWSEPFNKMINIFLDEILHAICKNIKDGNHEDRHEILIRMLLGTSFGVAIQYIMAPERKDILNCFDVLHSMVVEPSGY